MSERGQKKYVVLVVFTFLLICLYFQMNDFQFRYALYPEQIKKIEVLYDEEGVSGSDARVHLILSGDQVKAFSDLIRFTYYKSAPEYATVPTPLQLKIHTTGF